MVQFPEAPVTVHVLVASCTDVTVYPVGVIPDGAVTVTVARPSPATAVGIPGALGATKVV